MHVVPTMADLFEVEPSQWGLRGDPYLWRDMRAHLVNMVLPSSEAELEDRIKAAYEALTGRRFDDSEPFCIAMHAHGGMSSGMVSPAFWQGPGMRLLKDHHETVWLRGRRPAD
jgi:hypothetical protein